MISMTGGMAVLTPLATPAPTPAPGPAPAPAPAPAPIVVEKPQSNPPKDGKSHVNKTLRFLLRPVNHLVLNLYFKIDKQGLENIPTEGKTVFAPTHKNYFDPSIVSSLSNRDLRFMAAEEEFVGFRGFIMRNLGAFPVNRQSPGLTPIKHAVEVLENGSTLVIFPEGHFTRGQNLVDPLQPGTGWIVCKSKADQIVPIAIDIQETTPTALNNWARAGITLGTTAATVASTAFRVPWLTPAVGAVVGGAAGAWLASRLGSKVFKDPVMSGLLSSLTFGPLGLIGGAVAGASMGSLGASPVGLGVATAVGLVGGTAFSQFAQSMQNRDVLKVKVGTPIQVAPFLAKYPKAREAGEKLTEELYNSLVALKTDLQPKP